jgi:hypothetical protein
MSKTHNSIDMFSLKTLYTGLDSNPGLLSPRLMRCPLRHAARAKVVHICFPPQMGSRIYRIYSRIYIHQINNTGIYNIVKYVYIYSSSQERL